MGHSGVNKDHFKLGLVRFKKIAFDIVFDFVATLGFHFRTLLISLGDHLEYQGRPWAAVWTPFEPLWGPVPIKLKKVALCARKSHLSVSFV